MRFEPPLAAYRARGFIYVVIKNRNAEGVLGLNRSLKLSDILVTVVIAIVFGLIYKLWAIPYDLVKTLGLQLDQFIYGMWFIAATIAFLLIRKPGVALLAEVAASSGEFIVGSEWGLTVLLYGILQGLGAEIVFALFRYKRYSVGVVALAAIGSTVGSLVVDVYYGYITDLALWNLTLLIAIRTAGAILISGVFAYAIVKALESTGVTQSLRPVGEGDWDVIQK
jgi:energy-coupling factor transport system substrate-specific component